MIMNTQTYAQAAQSCFNPEFKDYTVEMTESFTRFEFNCKAISADDAISQAQEAHPDANIAEVTTSID
jgi:hypothetical protein